MRIVKQNILLKAVYTSGVNYPAPSNLTYLWNYGSLALLCLVIQIITGIFLAMYYTGEVSQAFLSIEHIMRDVNYGWLLRYIHANGASMFFTVVYIHLFRGLYYGSYSAPRELLWCTGVVIVLVMIITAFLGYVLPWGQMSFWAATVITNLCSAIPVIGLDVVYFLWGGFSVDNATLGRFFSLHFFLPFILTGLIIMHLIFLHENGSNNPLGIECKVDNAPFSPYFTIKDLYGVVLFLGFFGLFVFYMPDVLGHPDNYMEANPLVTPSHIVPEWYFLPFYGILRSIPDKLGGVIALVGSIIVLLLLPYMIKGEIRSGQFRPIYQGLFWFILIISLILGWIGGHSIKYPFYDLGQIATVLYFLYILGILPTVVFLEYLLARVSLYRQDGISPKPLIRYSGPITHPVIRRPSTKRYKLESLQSDLTQTFVQRGVRVIYYGFQVSIRPLVGIFRYSPPEISVLNIPQYKLLKTVKLWQKVKLIFKDRRGISWVHR